MITLTDIAYVRTTSQPQLQPASAEPASSEPVSTGRTA